MVEPADTVVIKREDHVFTVNGEDFPWPISAPGPQVKRLGDSLYSVSVEIFCINKETLKELPFTCTGYAGRHPVIDGKEFPWALTYDGYTFSVSPKQIATVSLAFLARSVDLDEAWIEDTREIFDGQGSCWQHAPKDEHATR